MAGDGERGSAAGAPGPTVLELARAMVEELGRPLGAGELPGLAERAALPVAAVRGAVSSYADLAEGPAELRVCVGTSCALAGGERLAARVAADAPTRTAHCLGHCDRSPAVLRRDGAVVFPGRDADAAAVRAAAPGARPPVAVRARCRPVVTARLGRGGPADLAAAREAGAYAGLARALRGPPSAVTAALERAGLRGRGGAAFPTAAKWRRAAAARRGPRVVVANGDEGDPGSFVDRLLMEEDPHGVIEGMALCGLAVGAEEGVAFVRSEYPAAAEALRAAAAEARSAGILGRSVLGSGVAFDVRVAPGFGSYVCGEETALLESLEGCRCEVRLRPPYPVDAGLRGRPTVIDNVATLVSAAWIAAHGPDRYAAMGTPETPGTAALCLNHGFARPGVVEVETGTPLRAVIEDEGGGPAGAAPLAAVLVGGPMGSVVAPADWDVPVCFAAMARRGLVLGHGGLVAVPGDADPRDLLLGWLRFMAAESCGRCTPCRLGSRRALELAEGDLAAGRAELERLLDVIARASLCGFGQGIPGAVRGLIDLFGERLAGAPAVR
ncbi:NADH-ubiquinone oxidoreductase-F iron-sulfur binding region domain-containing protein [Miltoncostaea marina]|uniref:NADH-ubiquinone oxidoreductase-F iron-sulfur binding region domain-containing protein n=1 Tax=Miltoncostaea marina TaxID=2843215 RepID=UPI001C3C7D32|nr:NADH-ubiquinone oxidoreductase-F iron-sulfur binding region domain-containing protein [Miltoncostaea marina]